MRYSDDDYFTVSCQRINNIYLQIKLIRSIFEFTVNKNINKKVIKSNWFSGIILES